MDIRRAAAFIVFGALIISCVHASRKPAQAGTEQGCEEGFSKFFPMEIVQSFESDMRQAKKMKRLVSTAISTKINDALKPAPASCDREMRLSDLKNDLDLRIADAEKQIARTSIFERQIVPMAYSPLLNDPKLMDAGICFTECLEKAGEQNFYGKRGECARSCGMKDPDGEGRDVASLANLIHACRTSDDKIDRAKVKKSFEQYFYAFGKFVRANEATVSKENADSAKFVAELRQQRTKLTKFFAKREKPKMVCARPQPKMALKIAEATHKVNVIGSGTGFVVKDGEGRRMVTAAHIYDKSPQKNLEGARATSMLAAFVSKGDPKDQVPFQFTITPGMQNFANDVSTAVYTQKSEAFDLVESGKIPDPRVTYFAAGFPDSERGFQIYPCEFKGVYFSPDKDPAPAYMFDCHYTAGPVQGMSGGPVFDEQGRVWGVLSAQAGMINLIVVRPIFKDKDGKLALGFQETVSTEYCLADDYQSFRTCQIVPGANENGY